MRFLLRLLTASLLLVPLTACGRPGETAGYVCITAQQAKEYMDAEPDCVILDVREQAEYDEGHIPGAVLLPHDKVASEADALLPDKTQRILVYCRSGRRSKLAAESLVQLGYTNVMEFGGIIDWPYDVERP